jgi:hypothetical protein
MPYLHVSSVTTDIPSIDTPTSTSSYIFCTAVTLDYYFQIRLKCNVDETDLTVEANLRAQESITHDRRTSISGREFE